MTEEVFQGRHVFGAMPAAAGTAWRGLSIQLSVDFPYPDTTGVAPIPFDVVLADTDGIYNGTDGGIVPVEMAGLWRLAGQVLAAASSPIAGLGEMDMTVNGSLATGDFRAAYYQVLADSAVLPFPFSPIVLVLAEGDEVQIQGGSSGGGAPFAVAWHSWFLMEYLGPVPEVS